MPRYVPCSTPMRDIGISRDVSREYHAGSAGSRPPTSWPVPLVDDRYTHPAMPDSRNGDLGANGSRTGTLTYSSRFSQVPAGIATSSPDPSPARVREKLRAPSSDTSSGMRDAAAEQVDFELAGVQRHERLLDRPRGRPIPLPAHDGHEQTHRRDDGAGGRLSVVCRPGARHALGRGGRGITSSTIVAIVAAS